ncbi:hypothetical protein B0T22DRAFT_161514 [Podospora appendiculata]|uniref:Rhodopsin domain-containing protein n=1 Tax=Podospora appendiculata TaxID=314037 RepID=A0AAE0X9V5_9PEZI|nr:hypothetical protein B0T22DRAFT_161514 [Podospora appendiculata]
MIQADRPHAVRFWDLSPETATVAAISVSITWVIVLLRCFTRLYIVKAFGCDDKLMVLAMVLYTAFGVFATLSARSRTGTLLDQLTNAEYRRVAVYLWICFWFYFFIMAIAKVSIACFLLRLTRVRAHRLVIKGTVVGAAVFGMATMGVAVFQCRPVNYFWDKTISGTCLDPRLYAKISLIINGIASLTSDLVLALTPAWIMAGLQMKWTTKIGLILLMSLGCLCNISVISRWVLLSRNPNPNDPATGLDVAGWTTLEQGMVISAGSLASIWPLARWTRVKLGLSRRTRTADTSASGPIRVRTSTTLAASYQRISQTVSTPPIPLSEMHVSTRCTTTVEEMCPADVHDGCRHLTRVTACKYDSVETLKQVPPVHLRV